MAYTRLRPGAKISKSLRTELLLKLAQALTNVRTLDDSVALIQDLLTAHEATFLAKRLAIADAILDGLTYLQISRIYQCSAATVARVAEWLRTSGRGYQLLHDRRGQNVPRPGRKLLRGRPTIYNWVWHLLDDLGKGLDDVQRARLVTHLEKLNEKSQLYRELRPLVTTLRSSASAGRSSSSN